MCTGNTCRSPLAEGLGRAAAERQGLDVEVRSAGTATASGARVSVWAEIVAGEVGVDLTGHRSSCLTEEAVGWADLVVGMARSHLDVARELDAKARLVLVTEYLPSDHPEHGADVSDPVGLDRDAYARTRDVLAACIEGLLGAAPGADEGISHERSE